MQNLAVLALVILLVLLFRWLGAPTRRPPDVKKHPKTKPDEDVPPPMMMG
jgi:hypothetical protein